MEEETSTKTTHLKFFGIPKIIPYLKPYKFMMLGMILLSVSAYLIDIVFPKFQEYAINHYIGEGTLDTIRTFTVLYTALLLINIEMEHNKLIDWMNESEKKLFAIIGKYLDEVKAEVLRPSPDPFVLVLQPEQRRLHPLKSNERHRQNRFSCIVVIPRLPLERLVHDRRAYRNVQNKRKADAHRTCARSACYSRCISHAEQADLG